MKLSENLRDGDFIHGSFYFAVAVVLFIAGLAVTCNELYAGITNTNARQKAFVSCVQQSIDPNICKKLLEK